MTSEGRKLSLYLGLSTSVTGFLQPFVPIYMLEAGLTKGQIGIVAGAGALLALLIQPILGRLSDRFDARRPFVAGSAIAAALAYLSFPYLHGMVAFLIAVALGANAFMYMQGVGGVLVGRLAAEGKGGATYASYRFWGSVGYAMVATATAFTFTIHRDQVHGRDALDMIFKTGPLLFVVIAALSFWLPDPKRPPSNKPAGGKAYISPNLRRFLAVDFLYIISLYGATQFISIFLKQIGGSTALVSCVFLPGVIAEALVMRKSGAYSDHYGRRPVLAISYLLLPFRLLMYAVAPAPGWVLAIQTLHGLNFGIVGAVAIAFVNDQADHETRGALQAQLTLVTASASAVGPMLMGNVADWFGLRTMFVVAAVLAAVALAVFLLFVDESNTHAKGSGIGWLDRRLLGKST